MKKQSYGAIAAVALFTTTSFALNIPGDGSDGAFNPSTNTVVDLSLAATNSWNVDNEAFQGLGVYDSNKWAVVFKYSSVNIPAGVTVTFINHDTRAPVVWLVEGNVTIDGTLNLAGQSAPTDLVSKLTPTEPGPGGFRGGASGPAGSGRGYGPGENGSSVASYASSYGNPQIIPLIGGSGFGWGTVGAGGGGAILIAARGTVTINGVVNANGGAGASGGAVRIIAESVSGAGEIKALPDGRIRIETPALAEGFRTAPETVGVSPAAVPIIWPADDAPTCRVFAVDGRLAPEDPTAELAGSSDVQIEKNGVVQVELQTKNFPSSGIVELRTVQKYGPAAWVRATHVEGGSFAESRWIANVTFVPGFTTLQAKATVP